MHDDNKSLCIFEWTRDWKPQVSSNNILPPAIVHGITAKLVSIGNKTCFILKLSTFYVGKDIYVNTFESVIDIKMCALQTRT